MAHQRWMWGAAVAALLVSGVGNDASVGAVDTAITAAVVADIAGTHYEIKGTAECRAAADASIYDVPASMWHASFADPKNALSRVNVTLWQPTTGGPAQLTLLVAARSQTHEIVTIPARMNGSAIGRFERQGAGGSLVVEGRTASQQPIRVRVSCSQFLPAEDNG